jgi:lipopolysaccharide/colanic/teichoic acid biosynthesis glycosyltransferase
MIERQLHQPEPDGGGERRVAKSNPGYEFAKRSLDLFVAGAVLLVLSPLWILIGLAIRATSLGPALYRGRVIGKDGVAFTYYKFRTMVAGDDSHHKQWLKDFVLKDAPYQGRQFKVLSDPRVTPVGIVLRRLSLDEIPQLINVLRGEMSIVGPRPPVPFEFELYDARARRRLNVKPGITGLYQVSARSQVPFSRMLAIDLDYIQRRSLALDLQIMFRTIGIMVSGKGAA